MMFEKLINTDVNLLIYLNNLGSSSWDSFWIYITKQEHWIPLFLVLLFFIFRKSGVKKGIYVVLLIAVLIAITNGFTDYVKNTVERLRPCNVDTLKNQIRHFTTIYNPQSYSFFSGHSSNSAALTVFLILLYRKQTKWIYLLVLFPLVFAYSRIYLGFHFSLDILAGYSVGAIIALSLYRFTKRFVTSHD